MIHFLKISIESARRMYVTDNKRPTMFWHTWIKYNKHRKNSESYWKEYNRACNDMFWNLTKNK